MTEKTNEGICECGHKLEEHQEFIQGKPMEDGDMLFNIDCHCKKFISVQQTNSVPFMKGCGKCQNYRYKKIKMVKCPHCKEEIDYLNYKIVKETTGTFSVDDKGFEEYDEDYIENRYEEYLCPECKEEIKDINVYDFLKGDVK